MFSPGPIVPTGQTTLDWNTEDRLETVSVGDTLAIGGPKTSRILIGQRPEGPSFETQASGSIVGDKLIGSFSSVYNGAMAPDVRAQQSAEGTINGTNTAFSQSMTNGGIILWEDGGVTPIAEYVSATVLTYPFAITPLPVRALQRFKIYYDGCYLDGKNSVIGGSTYSTSSMTITQRDPDTPALVIQNTAFSTVPVMTMVSETGFEWVRAYPPNNAASLPAAIFCDTFNPVSTNMQIGTGIALDPLGANISISMGGNACDQIFIDSGNTDININPTGVILSQLDNSMSLAVTTAGIALEGIVAVDPPDNTHAQAAGVPVNGIYKGPLDPAILYIRTA